MTADKRARLEAAGWTVGDANRFLSLTRADQALLDTLEALGEMLRVRRLRAGLSQARVALLVQSSQSRVAKMEAGDPSVSLDLVIRTLLVLATPPTAIAKTIVRGLSG